MATTPFFLPIFRYFFVPDMSEKHKATSSFKLRKYLVICNVDGLYTAVLIEAVA